MPKKLKTLLSIAGSDPVGGAGIQADIKAGTRVGVHVMTVITAVTSQNSKGIQDLGILPNRIVKTQIDSILEDVLPDAVKIGMIGSYENALVIEDFLNTLSENIPVVIDPVLTASADHNNLFKEESLLNFYVDNLFPLATVITPNFKEFNTLNSLKTESYIITGIEDDENINDILYSPEGKIEISHKKISCINLHGTGCTFSSLLASYLALGYPLNKAFQMASQTIHEIIFDSMDYKLGTSEYGPLNINKYKL